MSNNFDISGFMQSLNIFNSSILPASLRGIIILIVGYFILRLLAVITTRILKKNLSKQSTMIIRKGILYTGMLLVGMIVLQQFGIKPSALLGAAGVIGIALGFASQTSVSNIISGLFLIGENPFHVGDIISVGDKKGVVLSIDLLSIKLRTFDNQFIRIPNENLIKTDVVNITRFPIRRMDLKLGVAFKEDIRKVLSVLQDIAEKNHFVLDEPEPFIMFDGFGKNALEITYGVWFVRDDWKNAKTEIMIDIKERFDSEGIEIPFPHITLYTGSKTRPFPIALKGNNEKITEAGSVETL